MSTVIEQAVRVFKIGSVSLPDPDASMTPEEAIKLYAGSYPQVVDGTLSGPTVNDKGECVYEVERPAVKSKG